jgi:hypothetical protein
MVRILVAGDVEGKLDMLFDRVSALHNSKNGECPFSGLIAWLMWIYTQLG